MHFSCFTTIINFRQFLLFCDQCRYFSFLVEDIAAMQSLIGNLNDEVDVDVLRVEFLDKVVSGLHGSTGGEEIVVE